MIKTFLICGLIVLLGTAAYAADVTSWDFGLKPAKLLKTGQTTQYDSQADDGSLQKGIARSYTALTTGSYAGTTNITISGDTIAMENACVTDNNTGLMWMKNTPDSDIGDGHDGKLYWFKTATADNDIFAFCTAANAASLAGHDDWRVPNVFEIISLVIYDAGIGSPFIATAYFQCIGGYYWSSTTYLADTAGALLMVFDRGLVTWSAKDTYSAYVRLVRTTP